MNELKQIDNLTEILSEQIRINHESYIEKEATRILNNILGDEIKYTIKKFNEFSIDGTDICLKANMSSNTVWFIFEFTFKSKNHPKISVSRSLVRKQDFVDALLEIKKLIQNEK